MKRPKLVFDCDPGCDDALAIGLVMRTDQYDQIDILTVEGNVGVSQTTANARRIVTVCIASAGGGEGVTIYPGCQRSLTGAGLPASNVHGRDGMGDVPDSFLNNPPKAVTEHPLPLKESAACHAVDHLRQLAAGDSSFDLLCTGPLTNLAVALAAMTPKQEDKFWLNAQRTFVMGGNFSVRGNVTPVAEFNVFHDPVAVQIVLDSWRQADQRKREKEREAIPRRSCLPTIQFVPLDITERVVLDLVEFEKKETGRADAKFLRYAMELYGRFHALACTDPRKDKAAYQARAKKVFESQLLGSSGIKHWEPFCHMHDAVAAWGLLRPDADRVWDWVEDEIKVDTSTTQSRGRIQSVGSGAQPMSSAPPELGTRVRWLRNLDRIGLETAPPPKTASREARGPEADRFLNEIRALLDCQEQAALCE